jgi:hypothetical protein
MTSSDSQSSLTTDPRVQVRLIRMLMIVGSNIPASDGRPGDVASFPTTRDARNPIRDEKGRAIKLTGDQILEKGGGVLLTAKEALGCVDGKVYLTRHAMPLMGFTKPEISEAYDALVSDSKKLATLKMLHRLEIGEAIRTGDLNSLKDSSGANLWPEQEIAEVKNVIRRRKDDEAVRLGLATEAAVPVGAPPK